MLYLNTLSKLININCVIRNLFFFAALKKECYLEIFLKEHKTYIHTKYIYKKLSCDVKSIFQYF